LFFSFSWVSWVTRTWGKKKHVNIKKREKDFISIHTLWGHSSNMKQKKKKQKKKNSSTDTVPKDKFHVTLKIKFFPPNNCIINSKLVNENNIFQRTNQV
jgi:hypothetical protein